MNFQKDCKGPAFISHGKANSCGVLTAYLKQGRLSLKNKKTDKERRILVLDVSIDDSEYVLMNLYNATTEKEQIDVLSILSELLERFDTNSTKLVMVRDFNLFFESKLEAQSGNPTLKKTFSAKLIEFKETYEIRNKKYEI